MAEHGGGSAAPGLPDVPVPALTLRRTASLWGPVAAYILMVFLASSLPNPPGADIANQYLLHAGAYAVMGLLATRAAHGGLSRFDPLRALGALALTAGYGALDEVHQAFVPGRDPSALDALADAVGGLAAIALVGFWVRSRPLARGRAEGGDRGEG